MDMAGFAQDLRIAARTLRTKPLATTIAVLTLATGIGATTAVFSVLDAIAFRDLPVKDPSELTELSVTMGPSTTVGFSVPMVQALTRTQQVFSNVIGFASELATAQIGEQLAEVNLLPVTGNFFSDLGLRAALGRLITPGDMNLSTFSATPVAVLGHGFWQRRYAADPGAIGQTIRIEGKPYTIVGVAPRGFSAFNTFTEPDVTVPMAASAANDVSAPGLLWIHLVGRLKSGVTRDQARAGLGPLWDSIKAELVPATYAPARRANFLSLGLNVRSARTGLEWNGRSRFMQPLGFTFALALVVLSVGCLNVAGLMLARAAARAHDIGIRMALGASVWALRRQAIAEALVLSSTGAVLGLLIAQGAAPALAKFMMQEWTGTLALQLTPDGRALAIVAASVIAVCVLFAALPVWRVHHRGAAGLLQGGARIAAGMGRLAPILVAAQVALALIASIDAGLLGQTLQHFASADPGFSRSNITVADLMTMPGADYLPAANPATNAYDRQLVDAIHDATGVRDIALAAVPPLTGVDWTRSMAAANAPAEPVAVAYDVVSPEFVRFFGLTLREGRDFTWADNSGRPRVALVSESLARRLFPGRSAIGEYINFGPLPAGQHIEIVGVLKDFTLYDVKNGSPLTLLLPLLQGPESASARVLLRGFVPDAPLGRAVRSLGREYVLRVRSLDEIARDATRQEQFAAIAGSLFGGIAIGLAALGLYGLLTYVVARRTREFAIRIALGGRRWTMVALVLRQGVLVAAIGAAIGAVAAFLSVRWLQSLLYGITIKDAFALGVVPLFLVGCSIVASAAPALRAARSDPLLLLREE